MEQNYVMLPVPEEIYNTLHIDMFSVLRFQKQENGVYIENAESRLRQGKVLCSRTCEDCAFHDDRDGTCTADE